MKGWQSLLDTDNYVSNFHHRYPFFRFKLSMILSDCFCHLSERYRMVCPPVQRDNARASASGSTTVQADTLCSA